jgi:hypothetical protein
MCRCNFSELKSVDTDIGNKNVVLYHSIMVQPIDKDRWESVLA